MHPRTLLLTGHADAAGIAIVGVAGRLQCACDVDTLWPGPGQGVESVETRVLAVAVLGS
jgi:hypothetical protein